MKLTAANAPGREIVLAYTLTFNSEGSKLVVADLERLVEEMAEKKADSTGRIDPLKIMATDGMREMLAYINRMRVMGQNPQWLEIERQRQMGAARQKEDAR